MRLENGKVWTLWRMGFWRDPELLAVFASKEAAELAQSRLERPSRSMIQEERVIENANEAPLWEAWEDRPGKLEAVETEFAREMPPDRLEQYEKQWTNWAWGYSRENAVARLEDRLKERKEV